MSNYINPFQADDCSFLAITKKSDTASDCDQLFGTVKITGVGIFTIENTGDCGAFEFIPVMDTVGHPSYDESIPTTDENQLPIEVWSTRSFLTWTSLTVQPNLCNGRMHASLMQFN